MSAARSRHLLTYGLVTAWVIGFWYTAFWYMPPPVPTLSPERDTAEVVIEGAPCDPETLGDSVHIAGKVDLALYRADGALLEERHLPNQILNLGRTQAVKLLLGYAGTCPAATITPGRTCGTSGACGTPARFNCVCIGTNATAETAGDTYGCLTATGTPPSGRVLTISATPGIGIIDSTYGLTNPGSDVTITEIGLLTPDASGNCNWPSTSGVVSLSRRTLTPGIRKTTSEVLKVTWTITIS